MSTCEIFKVNQKIYFYFKFVEFLSHKVEENDFLLILNIYSDRISCDGLTSNGQEGVADAITGFY